MLRTYFNAGCRFKFPHVPYHGQESKNISNKNNTVINSMKDFKNGQIYKTPKTYKLDMFQILEQPSEFSEKKTDKY